MEKTPIEVRPTCKDCRHSDKIVRNGAQAGQVVADVITICRAAPPIVAHAFMPTQGGGAQVMQQSLWPIVTASDYCGKLETRAD